MTLVEILLTLCLLVVLASLTWPALGRPMAMRRLRESADQVRTGWVRARVEAMSSGEVHVFRYTPGGNTYTIQELTDSDATTQATDAATADADPGLAAEDSVGAQVERHRLSDKIRFVAGQVSGQPGGLGTSSAGTGNAASGSPDAASGTISSTTDASGVAAPIYFNVDGTCCDAQLWLENEYGRRIGLSLRGVTGVVTVNDNPSDEGVRP